MTPARPRHIAPRRRNLGLGLLAVDLIRVDGDTQARHAVSDEAVADYADLYRAGAELPPVVVFFDGEDYWLGDGFHRVAATRAAEFEEIEADVRSGTRDDAEMFSCASNRTHGLRRTNADKRSAVLRVLRLRPTWSDRAVAEHVGVDHKTVAAVRASTGEVPQSTVREGRDGRLIDTANIGRREAARREIEADEAVCDVPATDDIPGHQAVEPPDADTDDDDDFDLCDLPACRVCGCTDEDCSQCMEATGHACFWVEDPEGGDLCSRCADELAAVAEAPSQAELAAAADDARSEAPPPVDTSPSTPAASSTPAAPPATDLPDDERAPFDAYWTPDATARACLAWLVEHVLPQAPVGENPDPDPATMVEPAVGGGAWVRAARELLPAWLVDRFDVDPQAPGLLGSHTPIAVRRGLEQSIAKDWLTWEPNQYAKRTRWRLCAGNRPYDGPFDRWFEVSMARADVVAYLERETITGTETRLGWWLEHPPAFVAKVVPRPKWEGPGARSTADFSDSVLVVWVRGWTEPTRFAWIDARPETRP